MRRDTTIPSFRSLAFSDRFGKWRLQVFACRPFGWFCLITADSFRICLLFVDVGETCASICQNVDQKQLYLEFIKIAKGRSQFGHTRIDLGKRLFPWSPNVPPSLAFFEAIDATWPIGGAIMGRAGSRSGPQIAFWGITSVQKKVKTNPILRLKLKWVCSKFVPTLRRFGTQKQMLRFITIPK